jgi:hypothetical protein
MPLYVEMFFFLANSSLLFSNEDIRIPKPQNISDNNINCDIYKTKIRYTQFLADLNHLEVVEMHVSCSFLLMMLFMEAKHVLTEGRP